MSAYCIQYASCFGVVVARADSRAGKAFIASLPGPSGGHIAGDAGPTALITHCLFLVHTDEPSGNGLVPSSIKIMPLYEHDLRLIIAHVLYGHNKNMIWRNSCQCVVF